eukprot:CAMPEP_0184737354 /NCGR_PEP_ID=MMETSP0315-20130426/152_1 /TAXON_ID=101924 /ORGANISM="Rhodosorus marinus, Strain UTEX LB 2760" /LENGTH=234 /DNA_ID=CAMNT_0027204513 /DNA_START=219 /DNA_END=923 /DNA_ORIENTATION=+
MAFIANISFKPGGIAGLNVCSRRARIAVKSAGKGGAIVAPDDSLIGPEEDEYELDEEPSLALPGNPGVVSENTEPAGKLEKPKDPKVVGIQRVVDTVETVEVESAVDPRGNAMASPLPASTFGSTPYVAPSPSSFAPPRKQSLSFAYEETTVGASSNGSDSPSSSSQPRTGKKSAMKDFQLAVQEERNAMLKKQRASSAPAQEPTEVEDSTTETTKPDDSIRPFEYRSYEYWNK